MKVATPTRDGNLDVQEYAFTDADFKKIAALANQEYGLCLQESKKPLVYSRLARRIRKLNLDSFHEYCTFLETPEGKQEQPNLLSALTTNVTHFFRERHHFDQLRSQIIPELLAEKSRDDGIRIWSAACSAGQEAYCLAATVLEVCADAASKNIKILATDVDPVVIETAKRGSYPNAQIDAIEPSIRKKMVDQNNSTPGHFVINSGVRELVSFGQLNLMHNWPMRGKFDIIMCRNAAIYFDKSTQGKLWARFEQMLSPRGYLMIGHSERLSGEVVPRFKSVGVTTYQRVV